MDFDKLSKIFFNRPSPPPPSQTPEPAPTLPPTPVIHCPFCLKENPYTGINRNCSCGKEAPAAYINEISETKPLWVHTVGFTGHGKTVYLSLLMSFIEKIAYIWTGSYYRPLNDDALVHIQECREKIREGAMPIKTMHQADFPTPVLTQLKGMKRWQDRCLIMHDLAGEDYATIQNTSEAGKFIKFAPTSLFLVSLSELGTNGNHQNISDLFNIYISALDRMGAPSVGRNIIIVFTKADVLDNLPKQVLQYLSEDQLWDDLSKLKRHDFNETYMESYVQFMHYISNELRQFTIDKIDAGLQLISAAEGKGINLRFCVTSALGSPTNSQNAMTVPISPKRIFDPLFWILEMDLRSDPKNTKP
jgi:hypothetical protein